MFRSLTSTFLLAAFLACALGPAQELHNRLEGPQHNSQHCSVCHDLTFGAKGVALEGHTFDFSSELYELTSQIPVEEPALVPLNSSATPRAPPLA